MNKREQNNLNEFKTLVISGQQHVQFIGEDESGDIFEVKKTFHCREKVDFLKIHLYDLKDLFDGAPKFAPTDPYLHFNQKTLKAMLTIVGQFNKLDGTEKTTNHRKHLPYNRRLPRKVLYQQVG